MGLSAFQVISLGMAWIYPAAAFESFTKLILLENLDSTPSLNLLLVFMTGGNARYVLAKLQTLDFRGRCEGEWWSENWRLLCLILSVLGFQHGLSKRWLRKWKHHLASDGASCWGTSSCPGRSNVPQGAAWIRCLVFLKLLCHCSLFILFVLQGAKLRDCTDRRGSGKMNAQSRALNFPRPPSTLFSSWPPAHVRQSWASPEILLTRFAYTAVF